MNFVFWLLVILGIVLLWFLLAFTYKEIGRGFYRIWKNAIEAINIKDTDSERKD